MTVAELRRLLARYADEDLIVMAPDPDACLNHSELAVTRLGRWEPQFNEFYGEHLDPNHDYDAKDTVSAVAFYPKARGED